MQVQPACGSDDCACGFSPAAVDEDDEEADDDDEAELDELADGGDCASVASVTTALAATTLASLDLFLPAASSASRLACHALSPASLSKKKRSTLRTRKSSDPNGDLGHVSRKFQNLVERAWRSFMISCEPPLEPAAARAAL